MPIAASVATERRNPPTYEDSHVNTLPSTTLHEIQQLAEAAGRIPGTDAAISMHARIIALLGGGVECSGEPELPQPSTDTGCAMEPEKEEPSDLAHLIGMLRRWIALEKGAVQELGLAKINVEKLEDILDEARREKSAAFVRIAHFLGDDSMPHPDSRNAQPE